MRPLNPEGEALISHAALPGEYVAPVISVSSNTVNRKLSLEVVVVAVVGVVVAAVVVVVVVVVVGLVVVVVGVVIGVVVVDDSDTGPVTMHASATTRPDAFLFEITTAAIDCETSATDPRSSNDTPPTTTSPRDDGTWLTTLDSSVVAPCVTEKDVLADLFSAPSHVQ